jgi:tRNA wybutosine-synthesizing protein 4
MKGPAGMTSAECFNMNQIYAKRLDQIERARIEKLEIFDEFEEWDLL